MSLPPGYTGRAPTRDDADEIAAVIHACYLADTGESAYRVEDLLEEWGDIDIARDAYVVTTDSTVVAYTNLFHRGNGRFNVDGYVHPAHTGRGIGTFLLRLAEGWAKQRFADIPDDLQIVLDHGIDQGNAAAQRLFQVEGYTLKRRYYRMVIELAAAPPEPTWPEGLYVRSFVSGQDERTAFEAVEDAFCDMWNRPPGTFERFLRRTQTEKFNPDLWLLAFEGNQPAGFALCGQREDKGWVGSLGVGRAWRQRGLGLALLYEAFGMFYSRDVRRVELTVDTDSPTGALRLYERAGMHPDLTVLLYQKELRPGREFLAAEE